MINTEGHEVEIITQDDKYDEILSKLKELDTKINEVSVKADRMQQLIRPAIEKLEDL